MSRQVLKTFDESRGAEAEREHARTQAIERLEDIDEVRWATRAMVYAERAEHLDGSVVCVRV